ncbi:MAG: hypothetical protein HRT45_06280 [Bdellovibrionales bacterium]|nr:hypothetical protein [Bdellovibrionales bacterium]
MQRALDRALGVISYGLNGRSESWHKNHNVTSGTPAENVQAVADAIEPHVEAAKAGHERARKALADVTELRDAAEQAIYDREYRRAYDQGVNAYYNGQTLDPYTGQPVGEPVSYSFDAQGNYQGQPKIENPRVAPEDRLVPSGPMSRAVQNAAVNTSSSNEAYEAAFLDEKQSIPGPGRDPEDQKKIEVMNELDELYREGHYANLGLPGDPAVQSLRGYDLNNTEIFGLNNTIAVTGPQPAIAQLATSLINNLGGRSNRGGRVLAFNADIFSNFALGGITAIPTTYSNTDFTIGEVVRHELSHAGRTAALNDARVRARQMKRRLGSEDLSAEERGELNAQLDEAHAAERAALTANDRIRKVEVDGVTYNLDGYTGHITEIHSHARQTPDAMKDRVMVNLGVTDEVAERISQALMNDPLVEEAALTLEAYAMGRLGDSAVQFSSPFGAPAAEVGSVDPVGVGGGAEAGTASLAGRDSE